MEESTYFFITWKIKNFSFCWHQNENELSSPIFYIEGLPGTRWFLVLFPRASKTKEDKFISCYVRYESEENSSKEVKINYELSVLGSDGLPLEIASSVNYSLKENDWGTSLVLEQQRVFLEQRDTFLQKDSLTIRCRIWLISQENLNMERYFATTRIEVEKVSLFGVVKKIDYCRFLEERFAVKFLSASIGTAPILMNIKTTEEGTFAEIKPVNSKLMKFCKCKLHFIDDQQNVVINVHDEILFPYEVIPLYVDTPVWSFPLTKVSDGNIISECKDPLLEIDKLTLWCEVAYSGGIISEKIEKVD